MISVTICHTHGLPTASPQSGDMVIRGHPPCGRGHPPWDIPPPEDTHARTPLGKGTPTGAEGDTHLPAAGTGMINVTICHTHGLPTANPQSSRVVITHEIPAIGVIAHGLAMASPYTRPDAGTLRRGCAGDTHPAWNACPREA